MIGVNGAFIRSVNYHDVAQNQLKVLYIFTGTEPTKAEIDALIQADPDKELRANALLSFASGRGDTLLQANFYDNLSPEYTSAKTLRWPLVDRDEDFVHLNDGTVGWFFFASCSTTNGRDDVIVSPTTLATRLHFTYIGDCGDEESDADLGIFSGDVDNERDYSTTDLEIVYV